MKLPFTIDQFLEVFVEYNTTIWPMHLIAYLLGLAALVLAVRKTPRSDRIVAGILAFFWLWMGIAYHWLHFSAINKAAFLFGGLFVLQGFLFAGLGTFRHGLSFAIRPGVSFLLGALFIAYAMLFYPLIGHALGHGYPRSPSFGVAPCPTTIFTFGLLLWTDRRLPAALLVVPFLWALVGMGAALSLGIREDTGLLIAGLVGSAVVLSRKPTGGKGSAAP